MDEQVVKQKVLNIDLSNLSKQKVIVDNDENRVLYIDVADMNVVVRLKEKLDTLQQLQASAIEELATKQSDDMETINTIAKKLKEIDTTMREALDYIFDANVSEVCAPSGNMFDFINGRARYEIVFDALMQLYDDNISAESKKIEKRVNNNKHTQKYVKK